MRSEAQKKADERYRAKKTTQKKLREKYQVIRLTKHVYNLVKQKAHELDLTMSAIILRRKSYDQISMLSE